MERPYTAAIVIRTRISRQSARVRAGQPGRRCCRGTLHLRTSSIRDHRRTRAASLAYLAALVDGRNHRDRIGGQTPSVKDGPPVAACASRWIRQ